MNQLVKKNRPKLHVVHQSEVLQLRRALANLQTEMNEMRMIMNANTINKTDRKIVLSSNGQHHFISLKDIIYCEADGNYTNVFIHHEKDENKPHLLTNVLVSKTLKSVIRLITSEDLPTKQACLRAGFIRCHQSYLINKNHVTGFETNNGLFLKLSNWKNIPVSRRNKRMVLDQI